ncbi:hypothetical protein [Methyloglobulus sp.]|uniref:hypothetical protein n=1 Tax=Methyloglobulus sp. TaxID=2518622 RepID=UPI003989D4C7
MAIVWLALKTSSTIHGMLTVDVFEGQNLQPRDQSQTNIELGTRDQHTLNEELYAVAIGQ